MSAEDEDSLHRCGMCGSCGKLPWWAPEVLKTLPPRDRIRLKRKLEDGRRAFVAIREEAAAKKAASEAASQALKLFAATKNTSQSESTLPDVNSPFALTNSIATASPSAKTAGVHTSTGDSPKSSPVSNGLQLALDPGASVLHSMKTKQETGFGDNKEGSLNEIQGGLKKMRESALASYDSDIDSDTAPSGLMCQTPESSLVTAPISSPSDDAYYTPKTGNSAPSSAPNSKESGKAKTEQISLGAAAVSSNGIPVASPEVTVGATPLETPELCATGSFDVNKHKRDLSSVTLGTVSLASSPEVDETKRSPVVSGTPLNGTKNKQDEKEKQVVEECGDCIKSNSRIRELELHIEALQCALKARELVSAGKKGKKPVGAKGENQRLREEVESLRLTVDFLFRKLQKYETSPRDRPEVH